MSLTDVSEPVLFRFVKPEHGNARDEQREATRKALHAAALRVFRRDGVSACRIDDIAKLAGTSRAAFYFHFPTKEHVVAELLREKEEQLAQVIAGVPPDAPLSDLLSAVAASLAGTWQDDRQLLPAVATVALTQQASQLGDREASPSRAALTPYFLAAAERGELRQELPAEVLGDAYLTNLLAGMMGWCANPRLPLLTVLEGINDLFLHGVLSAENPKSTGRKR